MARSLSVSRLERRLGLLLALVLLAGCSQIPERPATSSAPNHASTPSRNWFALPRDDHAQELVFYALGLLDTGYRFGGKNPEAGLDCSGMVSYIYNRAAGLKVAGSAADIARKGRPIDRRQLRPGDLVFFNTRNAPYSHVGLYIGDERFIHAPSTNGRVRIDQLNARYYAQRFEAARSYFD